MALEIELKFRIPPARLAAVRRAVTTRSARSLRLAAAYFDTPGELLARERIALRLRREGAGWVQTLKAEGADAMHRLEHNVPVAGRRRPSLDLSRHDGSEAGARLRRVMADARDEPLIERYATDVARTRRVLRHDGARIELSLDEGRIRAGARQLPLCELEFELLQGPPQALLSLAARWVDRFGLVLDLRSKSERGHWLAAAVVVSPPTKARPLQLSRQATPAQALAAMSASALGQALANASQIAAGPAAAEHLHQLRVGLRRLRSVMRVFAALVPTRDASLAPGLAALFDQLGTARDRDVMAGWLQPALQAAGAPAFALWPDADAVADEAVAALLQAPATQRLWLAALGACQEAPDAGSGAAAVPSTGASQDVWPDAPVANALPLRRQLARPVQRLMRQVQRDAGRFAELDDLARHRLRRRIKRLRYAAEAMSSLWPARAVKATLRALEAAQEPLGNYNDMVVALAHCRALAAQQSEAWFAVGWLAARRDAQAAPCARALGKLLRCRGFWRRDAGPDGTRR